MTVWNHYNFHLVFVIYVVRFDIFAHLICIGIKVHNFSSLMILAFLLILLINYWPIVYSFLYSVKIKFIALTLPSSWMQINVSSVDESLNLYDSGHRFEHIQLLLVLLRSLPYASRAFQARAIQVCFRWLTVNCYMICIPPFSDLWHHLFLLKLWPIIFIKVISQVMWNEYH